MPLDQEIINTNNLLVVTSENISGYKIAKVLGEVFDLTSRARKTFSDFGQGLEALISGEIREYTKLQHVARDQDLYRLRNTARDGNTDTVIIFHFGAASSKFGESVAAYGDHRLYRENLTKYIRLVR